MSLRSTHHYWIAISMFFILINGKSVAGDIEGDKQVLLNLKSHIQQQDPDYHKYPDTFASDWNLDDKSPCEWRGISCEVIPSGKHVTAIDLSYGHISGTLFNNFSSLPELRYLNLSGNLLQGSIPGDLSKCRNLRSLDLSRNKIEGKLNLTGFNNLEDLDLSINRIQRLAFPPKACRNLVVLKLSSNNISHPVDDILKKCSSLHFLDLESNGLTGNLSLEFGWLSKLSLSGNSLGGRIPSWAFGQNCRLRALDLSYNSFNGQFPKEISHCKDLETLNLSGNKFSGKIPDEVGLLLSLESLLLGDNNFSRDIPSALEGLSNLSLLDLSNNRFGGDIQEIFGELHQVMYLILGGNSYTGGLSSSQILKLTSISELDLSNNDFLGPLPLEIYQMSKLKMLVLANNSFSGNIPPEYGNLSSLQILDLSFNKLTGPIPRSFGRLSSVLWLMLANNFLDGQIPAELGNCSSLLWLNFANNQLLGTIPPQLFNIGKNPMPQFILNRMDKRIHGLNRCTTLSRWIPAEDNSPMAYFTLRYCENNWDILLEGYPFYPMCDMRTFGYIQLSGNRLSGEIPTEIRNLQNPGMLCLADNGLYGKVPPEIGLLGLIALNISKNKFSGEIPKEIGRIKCLQYLDLSSNNFSGDLPSSMSNLNDLVWFNISYNPFLSGRVPSTGQLSTFGNSSFLGNPLLELPFSTENWRTRTRGTIVPREEDQEGLLDLDEFLLAFVIFYPIFFLLSFLLSLLFWRRYEKLIIPKIIMKRMRRRM